MAAVQCPGCAVSLDAGLRSWSCPRCGLPLRERPRVRVEFEGDGIAVLGWILLAIPSVLLIVPLPWFLAALCRWFCRNLLFGDGAAAEFRGRAGEVLPWCLLPLAVIAAMWGGLRVSGDPGLAVFGFLVWIATSYSLLRVIRWCVAGTVLGAGERFRFAGTFAELLFWQVLNGLAGITVIGWAWTTAAMYRWAARHTRSRDRELAFHGSGFEALWRSLAVALFSLPVVTIPWAKLWYLRWVVSRVTVGSAGSPDDGD